MRDAHWFTTFTEFRQIVETWHGEYNESHPHRALGERTPEEFANPHHLKRRRMQLPALFTTGQTLVLSIVMIVLRFDGTRGGHVPCGVTAHGSPSGPLQFDRLEAALAARFY